MSGCTGAFLAFYRWLIFCGLCAFGLFIAVRQGLAEVLLRDDTSRLSVVILAFLVLASLDAGRRALQLGRELCIAMRLAEAARGNATFFRVRDNAVSMANRDSGRSFAAEHLELLANKTYAQGALCRQELLLERLEHTLGRGHETGWFLADLMVRLGLLGTVIGFIYMLGSVSDVASVDLRTLQRLLTEMTGGMRVALYTTLTGLSAGIVLGFQYRLLDGAVDRLMAEIIELSEVHATRHLQMLLRRD